jgi:exopolysaccharide production protein ExoZ
VEGKSTILAVQILRAVAALAVVLVHAGLSLSYWGHVDTPWSPYGNVGVHLFFVISGFIMVHISAPKFGERGAPSEFLARRLIRIVPLYWLFTTGLILAGSFPLWYIAASYFFVPMGRAGDQLIQPIVPQGWTLIYEVFFYLVFAAALILPRRIAIGAVALVMIGFVMAKVVPYYGEPIILEFVFGSFIGLAYAEGVRFGWPLRLLLVAAGLAAYAMAGMPPADMAWIYWGIPCALVVAGATLGAQIPDGRVVAAFVLVGDASYALYLSHILPGRVIANVMRDLVGLQGAFLQVVYVAITIGVSVAIAIAIYLFVERPMTRALLRRTIGRPPLVPKARFDSGPQSR